MDIVKPENRAYIVSISKTLVLLASLCAIVFGQEAGKGAVHPLLRKAWTQYEDYKNRDRDQVVKLFEEYLEEDPCSVFLAEVYYRLGSLYSNNANVKRGETTDRKKANEYFEKAHDLYGNKYNVEADAAWSFLAFSGGEPTSSRKAYYDWHRRLFEKGTAEDIYPVQRIALCVLYDSEPELGPDDKERRYRSYKKNFPVQIVSIERSLFLHASYSDLLDFVRSYPGSELARKSREQLNKIDDKSKLFEISELNGESPAVLISDNKVTPANPESQANEVKEKTEMSEHGSSVALRGNSSQADHTKSTTLVVYLLAVSAALGGGFLCYVVMRRKKAKDS